MTPSQSPTPRPWTPEEHEIVRARYLTDGAKALASELGRTERSVAQKAFQLGRTRKPRWSPDEDDQLRLLWEGLATVPAIARALGRTPRAVYRRAHEIGLQRGVPQGFESIEASARRTGFCMETLRRILHWGGVRRRRTMSCGSSAIRRNSHTCVDPFDVDEAIQRWLATETVSEAARRRGVSATSLAKWLRDAGVIDAPAGRKSFHRVPSEEIDRVIRERAERRAGLRSVSAEARRTGVSVSALLEWLKAADVPRIGKRPILVNPADVDRVVADRRAARLLLAAACVDAEDEHG